METGPVHTALADPRDADAMTLSALVAEHGSGFGRMGMGEKGDPSQRIFVLAWLGDHPVGCGAIEPVSGEVGELRGPYVLGDAGGLGVDHAILLHLQSRALQLCYRALRVDAAAGHDAAIRLYESFGFQSTMFDPEAPAIIRFEKRLGREEENPIGDFTVSNQIA